MSEANEEYDDSRGPPVCERCGEPCHWCEGEFKKRDDEEDQ